MGRAPHRRAVTTAAVVLLVGVLPVAGCGGGGDGSRAEPSSREVVISQVGPPDAPDVVTAVPAEDAWRLARLKPPTETRVLTSVQRPNETNVGSYLLVATTTPDAATALCDHVGLPTTPPDGSLDESARTAFDLAEDPDGDLTVCSGTTNGERMLVRRDVLVAASGGTATVWLSAFEILR